MATFKAIVFSTKNHIKNDGTTNIKIRIYHNVDSQYISTPFYILPNHMSNDGNVSSDSPDSDLINFEIGGLIQKYRGVTLKLGAERMSKMSCIEVREQIIAASEPEYEFIDFIEFSNKIIARSKKGTADCYQTAINALTWFYKRKKIDARDITSVRLNEFMSQLAIKGQNDKPLEPGAISNYMRSIRALYNKCKIHYNDSDFDIIRIPNDPFSKVKIPVYRRKRKNIPIETIKRIRDSKFETIRANLARDIFMMMFYLMGINVTDFFKLEKIKFGRIEYERTKMDIEDKADRLLLSIKVEPELQELFDRYSINGNLLSYFKERYSSAESFMRATNEGLETICNELNIPKITTNWARHSFATVARNNAGIAKADVDFCLGHTNNDYKMADIYIAIDYSIFDRTNRAVMDLLTDKSKKNRKKT